MNEKDYVNILNTIGYEPEDEETFFGLLQQAFIRRSYSMENGGQNNEILEFIGDKALDIAVIKKLTEYYDGGLNDDDEFEMEKHITEGKLTKIKEKLVERSMLAHRIEAMGLQEYLIMGKGDIAQNVQNEESVKEDLFEAIIGAITLDCNWDIEQIQDVVEKMLDIEYYLENGYRAEFNAVDLLQQWSQKIYGEIPEYRVYQRDDCAQEFCCELYLPDSFFRDISESSFCFYGEGYSKSQARMSAAYEAYSYLANNDFLMSIEDDLGEPCEERAINQLQELAQKGYCEMPEYIFEEYHDPNGNPEWSCTCKVKGKKKDFIVYNSSKKTAKKQAAYQMLMYILGRYDDTRDLFI